MAKFHIARYPNSGFNIFDRNGEKVNETSMSYTEAESYVRTLEDLKYDCVATETLGGKC